MIDGALDHGFLHLGVSLDVEDHGILGQHGYRLLVVELADAAAGVVDEMFVAVDLLRFLCKVGKVVHRTE